MNISEPKSFASESGHWYKKDGTPVYTIIGKNGKERNTTLRDARAEGYLPSVTTILSVAAKPALDVWKQTQVLMAALTLPRVEGETEQDYITRIIQDSKETGRKAANHGTEIHGAIESHYRTGTHLIEFGDFVVGAVEAVRKAFGEHQWCAEKSFGGERYGGKVDLHSPFIVIDFKTKEFDETSLPKAYDENIMQLAAYREGLGFPSARCANVFVSRSVPGLVHVVEHTQEEIERGYEMFSHLLNYWYTLKGL